jgi:NAD(P)H-dependent flavin oxidoreductase YrpB (nitropropane dioxygenase family)
VTDSSVLATPLCDRLGIQLPIVQAPIGSAATPELVAAVANAGGLGMLALTWVTVPQAVDRIRRVRQLSDRPFGVNLVLEFRSTTSWLPAWTRVCPSSPPSGATRPP